MLKKLCLALLAIQIGTISYATDIRSVQTSGTIFYTSPDFSNGDFSIGQNVYTEFSYDFDDYDLDFGIGAIFYRHDITPDFEMRIGIGNYIWSSSVDTMSFAYALIDWYHVDLPRTGYFIGIYGSVTNNFYTLSSGSSYYNEVNPETLTPIWNTRAFSIKKDGNVVAMGIFGVPEPKEWIMLMLGFFSIGIVIRQKKDFAC